MGHKMMSVWLHRLQHLCCGLSGGHTWLRLSEPRRLALVCTSCGKETPGWLLGKHKAEHQHGEYRP